ncbi:aminoglycoside phosphotransferase family protein [Nocardia cyriacigeorgica]|uniref:phosphotransferase family protein n=1 Tax=Nocardia cyriacigeorgica TaxID=135487 RepID=UPI002E20808E
MLVADLGDHPHRPLTQLRRIPLRTHRLHPLSRDEASGHAGGIHLTELRERWRNVPAGLPWCVVHGDAWGGNVVAADNGEVYLLDLERTSLGPPEWDTVHTAIKHHTFGSITDTDYRAFCDAYGHDVTVWAGYELLRDLREFRMTCMAAQSATENPTHREQADHRIACLRGKCGPRPWRGWCPIT